MKIKQLYLITAGLGGGFGGGGIPKELLLAEDYDTALEYAAALSREEVASYREFHGHQFKDELDEDEYIEEVESWIDYDATAITLDNYKEIIEDIEQDFPDDEIARIYNYINGLKRA